MKVDSTLAGMELADVPAWARRVEELGYDGIFTNETSHDPFFPLVLAAEHTTRVELGTGIAVAFPRSPMHLAYMGHDLHAASQGRFILGLGSQIKAHVEKRFSATWSRPAARMRELILAVRAIWRSWNEGEPLAFRGEFYRHTLMTPFFSPGPNPYGTPRIFLAAVRPRMSEVAGEVADGLLLHVFTTERYARETIVPAVERGLERAGRAREDFELACSGFAVAGADEREYEATAAAVRLHIAFYGSTPAYRGVLEAHGWGDLQDELHALSRQGRWAEMGELIDDEILDTFALCGETAQEVAAKALARYGGLADRISFYAPNGPEPERWASVLPELRRPR